jgi:hypothetical protein
MGPAAVSVGDTIMVGLTFADGGPTGGSLADSLGNTYTRNQQVHNTEVGWFAELWYCVVTHAGTPTVTAQFQPSPGTTAPAGFLSLIAAGLTGSDSASVPDGAGAGQLIPSPVDTSTDAIVSGTWATSVNGDLIFSICPTAVDFGTGTVVGSGATGGDLALHYEWLEQSVASGTTQATWTALDTSAKTPIAMAITAAGTGGPAAVLTGTLTAGITETDIVSGGKVLTITLSGDTWVPS